MLVKLINDKIIPPSYPLLLPNNKLLFEEDINILKESGYKELIDEKPEYNEKTHYLIQKGYQENDNNIIVIYEVVQIQNEYPEITPPKHVEERLIELEERLFRLETDMKTVAAQQGISVMLSGLVE